MAIKMNPVADRIVVRPFPAKTEMAGFHTLEKRQIPNEGEIVAVGPDCRVAKRGDKALYAKGAGADVEIDGIRYIYMRESDIYATLSQVKYKGNGNKRTMDRTTEP